MAWELDLLKEELKKKLYVHKYEVSFKHLYMTSMKPGTLIICSTI